MRLQKDEMLWNRSSRKPASTPLTGDASHSGVDFGWRVHNSQEAWTAKVDTKASILLALEGGLLVAVFAGFAEGGTFADVNGWRQNALYASVGLLIIAIISAAAAVFPILGSVREHRQHASENFIYFGHLRHLNPHDVTSRLRQLTAQQESAMLGRQLVAMSKGNWRKHQCVRVSVLTVLFAAGLAVLVVAYPVTCGATAPSPR
ncbi:Pycsar system effector family protein [Cellulomonas sp. ATA003]|uniref:Pycsar system effector family protein n=1 Tax=Cellulomonas sp. ATA003 TaxID=3073064 RepID=UPI0037C08E8D